MCGGTHYAGGGRRLRQDVVEAEQRGDQSFDGGVDVRPGRLATLERREEVLGAHHAVRHLDVETGGDRRGGVAHAEDPVADHESSESPFATEDIGEQRSVLPAPLAVHGVVRGHH